MPFDDPAPGGRLQLLIHGASTLRWIDLDRPNFVIGRAPDCEIVLSDPSVSRRHVALEITPGEVRFRELSDTNPVRLDGKRCPEGVLRVGSRLLVGLTHIELHAVDHMPQVDLTEDGSARTVVIDRPPSIAEDAGSSLPQCARLIAASLDSLMSHEPDDATFRQALLVELVELTGRAAAVLGSIENGALVVEASRGDPTRPLRIPRSALLAAPDGTPGLVIGADGQEDERIAIPIAGKIPRVLLLGRASKGAMRTESALALARALVDSALRIHAIRIASADAVREVARLRFARTHSYRQIVASMRLADARRRLSEAAHLRLPVRLCGEEGTEKSELAQFLHAESRFADGPFVECYVRLLPPTRSEQTMFGDDAALQRGSQCVARAKSGTIYVHEPELLEPDLQDRLAHEIELGSADDERPRFVLGHGCEPEHIHELGLSPRLESALQQAITVRVPPLRDRAQDIEALTELVLSELGPGPQGLARSIEPAALNALLVCDWPGNAAQHRRVVERAAMRAGGRPIRLDDLEEQVRDPIRARSRIPTLEVVTKDHIHHVIELCGGNKRNAARALGIASSTLYEWLKRFPLKSQGDQTDGDSRSPTEPDTN